MSKPLPPEGYDENPEWTAQDFARARPAGEVHPPHIAAVLTRRPRGRPAGSDKERVTLRVDRANIDRFKVDGAGWQTRINEAFSYMQPQMDNLVRLRDQQIAYIKGLKGGVKLLLPDGSDATREFIRNAQDIVDRLQAAIDDGRAHYGLAEKADSA